MHRDRRIAAIARLCLLSVVLVAGGPTATGTPRRELVCPRPAPHATAHTAAGAASPLVPSWLARGEAGSDSREGDVPAGRDFATPDAAAPLSAYDSGPPERAPSRVAAYRAPSVSLLVGRSPPRRA